MFPTNLTPSATVSFSLKFGNFIGAVLKFGPDHGMFGLGHLPLMILPYDSEGSHDHGLHHSTKPISQFWELETPNHHHDHTSSSSWWMFRCEVGHFPDICELKWGGASCGATWSEWSSLLISGLAHSGQWPTLMCSQHQASHSTWANSDRPPLISNSARTQTLTSRTVEDTALGHGMRCFNYTLVTIMSHCKINPCPAGGIAYLIVDVVCKCTRCHVTDSFLVKYVSWVETLNHELPTSLFYPSSVSLIHKSWERVLILPLSFQWM